MIDALKYPEQSFLKLNIKPGKSPISRTVA